MLSTTEENYLKAIYKIGQRTGSSAGTNAIAEELDTSAASVSDMIKRLAEKELVDYEKYKGARLTSEGNSIATQLTRKHRLWETFLVKKLGFTWDEVHEVAEQLEHVESDKLIDELDAFLGYPKFDPHGDPIPDASGKFTYRRQQTLSTLEEGDRAVIVGVREHSRAFLRYLEKLDLMLGSSVAVLERVEFDQSISVSINDAKEHILPENVVNKIYVQVEATHRS